jgi:hypothetical protein
MAAPLDYARQPRPRVTAVGLLKVVVLTLLTLTALYLLAVYFVFPRC